uniref:Uncharacterized protein n=1 Tax=Romanomermis culicivorax TaxID=13658 RepID=A0A915LD26_ROMCU
MISTILDGRKFNSDDEFDSADVRPTKCNAQLSRDQIFLQWPTILTIDPSNDQLYVLDSSGEGANSVIYVLNTEKSTSKVKLAAGIFPHCSNLKDDFLIRKRRKLSHVTGMAVGGNADGFLYFTEMDRTGSRLRKFDPKSGTLDILAGDYSGTSESQMAKNVNFGLPTQLISDFGDKLYILDKKLGKIFVLYPQKPIYDTLCRCYRITDPDAKETYLFNRKGQHVATKELIADKFLYNFTYTASSSYGSLIQINFQNRKKWLKIDRSDSQSSKITLIDDRSITEYKYDSSSNGLIVEKIDENGLKYNFTYDEGGRLVGKAGPTGEFLALQSKLIDGEIRSILFKNDTYVVDIMNDGRSSEIITGTT